MAKFFVVGGIFAVIGVTNLLTVNEMFWRVFPDREWRWGGRRMRIRELMGLRRLYRAKFPASRLASIELATEIVGAVAFLGAAILLLR